jgi:peptidoglycan/LPS O-acetylase OafA/YrhL
MTRIPRLDGLRALAFLAVFLNHSVHLPMAWVGVDLFFVLSGFLITSILLRDRALPTAQYFGGFYARRARRILPPYLIVLALVAALGLPGIEWSKIWWHFFTFLQNFSVAWGYGTGALTPYWSLAVEEQFYLFWPVVVLLVPRRHLAVTCVAIVVAAPLLRACFTPRVDAYTVIFCVTPFRIDLLAAGALLAVARDRAPATLDKAGPWAWLSAVLAALALFGPAAVWPAWRASAHSAAFNIWGYSCSVVLFASVLVITLTSRRAWLDRLLEARPLATLGRISYMCYLVHEPALQLAWQYLPQLAGAGVALLATLLFSLASWRWIESPLLRSGASRAPSRIKTG